MDQDYYSVLLGVTPGRRPPDHYQLIGAKRFENNTERIQRAFLDQFRTLKRHQTDPRPEISEAVQNLLDELARARAVLTDPKKKRAYDRELSRELGIDPFRHSVDSRSHVRQATSLSPVETVAPGAVLGRAHEGVFARQASRVRMLLADNRKAVYCVAATIPFLVLGISFLILGNKPSSLTSKEATRRSRKTNTRKSRGPQSLRRNREPERDTGPKKTESATAPKPKKRSYTWLGSAYTDRDVPVHSSWKEADTTELLDLCLRALHYEHKAIRLQAGEIFERRGKGDASFVEALADTLKITQRAETAAIAGKWLLAAGEPGRLRARALVAELTPSGQLALLKAAGWYFPRPVDLIRSLARSTHPNVSKPAGSLLKTCLQEQKDLASHLSSFPGNRLGALQDLFRSGSAPEFAQYILDCLGDEDYRVTQYASYLIQRMDPKPHGAVEALEEVLALPDKHHHTYAMSTLAHLGQPGVDAMLRALDSPPTCFQAILHLGKIGPAAKKALPKIREVIATETGTEAAYALQAEWKITKDPAIVMPRLLEMLSYIYMPGKKKFDSLKSMRKSTALSVVWFMGSDAKQAIPMLVRSVRESHNVRRNRDDRGTGTEQSCIRALNKIGGDAIPVILELYREGNATVRRIINCVFRYGQAKGGTTVLMAALQDPDKDVRLWAIRTFSQMRAASAIPLLKQARNDLVPEIRQLAGKALLQNRIRAAEPVDLLKNIGSSNPRTRLTATLALARQPGSPPASAIPALSWALREKLDRRDQIVLLKCLSGVGARAKPTLPTVRSLLEDRLLHGRPDDKKFILTAVEVLSHFGKEARPTLFNALAYSDPDVSDLAARALAGSGEDILAIAVKHVRDRGLALENRRGWGLVLAELGPCGLDALLELATESDESARDIAGFGFTRLKASCVPRLTKVVENSKDSGMLRAALVGLLAIGPASYEALPAAKLRLRSSDENVRSAALELLLAVGRFHGSCQRSLMAALRDKDPRFRTKAACTMAKDQLAPHSVIPALTSLLNYSDPNVRLQVIKSLGCYGSPALGQLILALKDEDHGNRKAAMQMIQKIGPSAMPALERVLNGNDDSLRPVVAETLRQTSTLSVLVFLDAMKKGTPEVKELSRAQLKAMGGLAPPKFELIPNNH